MSWHTRLLKNHKARARRRKLDKVGARLFKLAKETKDSTDLDNWYDENHQEFDSIAAEIKHNDSAALMDEAEKLYLPTPEYRDEEKWISRDQLNTPTEHWRVLTPEAMTELRTAIRKEKRERRETFESWIKILGGIIAALTGLVGAAIGLIAVLHKSGK
ncbi:MAG TPA: hypothetical protein VGG46_14365 [Terriglobales bacterium]|jgi:hypothetical protein